jgi:iron(II)-dependent oxidoreductase
MALFVPQETAAPHDAVEALGALDEVRAATLALVAHLDDTALERVLSPIMSPLAWDLAHIAAYEDLWLAHRQAGLALLRPDLAARYDAFETPRTVRGEIELLSAEGAREYMREVRGRVAKALLQGGVGDGVLCELVLRHELQHTETMRQAMEIAGILPDGEPRLTPVPRGSDAHTLGDGPSPTERLRGRDHAASDRAEEEDRWLEFGGGTFLMGAAAEGFAYDNERPRHAVHTGAFRIARRPVSNASWLHFSEGGGYERREWWSEEGWAWKQEHDITHHPAIAAGHPQAPACHVSWFEAQAFARAQGARLPSEAEWERAASAERGALAGRGQVWEWTSSCFGGYPGFVAHPYREYSEVFFGAGYRVLRGGSWATSERVASVTFRNWDLPQRRQIFAGVRLAGDIDAEVER